MDDKSKYDNIYDWIQYGVNKGWISEPICYSHDAVQTTPEEELDMDEGGDPCITITRLWNV